MAGYKIEDGYLVGDDFRDQATAAEVWAFMRIAELEAQLSDEFRREESRLESLLQKQGEQLAKAERERDEVRGILASAMDLANTYAREHGVAEGEKYDTSHDVRNTFERALMAVCKRWDSAERERDEAQEILTGWRDHDWKEAKRAFGPAEGRAFGVLMGATLVALGGEEVDGE